MTPKIEYKIGDCLEILKEYPNNYFDACITDPPYGFGFFGKEWDTLGEAQEMQKWHQNWASEVFRVLKPGAHLLAFGGPRTYHRLACAIEDSGFEIRDIIMWVYGSGFPKSTRINNRKFEGWGTALKPAVEPICLARKPIAKKTVAENVLEYGTGAINIDACRIPYLSKDDDQSPLGRFPSNLILECTCDKLIVGKASGSPSHWPQTKVTGYGEFGGGKSEYFGTGEKDDMTCLIHTDENCPCKILDEQKSSENSYSGISRIFYTAKASKSEREYGLEQNLHPTIKPIKLMRYLIRLVTPPNGIVLDPFLGSGTTLIACMLEGVNGVGIEKEKEYAPIIEGRLKADWSKWIKEEEKRKKYQ